MTADELPLSRSAADRGSYLREDPDALDAAWHDPKAQALVVDDGRTLLRGDGLSLAFLPAEKAPDGERYYLGAAEGTPYWAVRAPLPEPDGTGAVAAGLREIGTTVPALETGLFVHAVALERWHATHQHCPRCGARTEVVRGGSQRDCPADGSNHFPRVDPAVIMLVHDGDRFVLGHQARWPEHRYSILVGFVEPGESLERAVVREVHEEVGLVVDDVRYVGSQPWPFPSSLMLGFTARAVGGELAADEHEIASARWFTRAELTAAVASGDVLLPPRVSIARHIIERWHGDPALAENPDPWEGTGT